ncbi:dienelactone hydrolase family protein [Nocardia sp. NPDC005978]|uniref:dienelactone hydrolase family protein n=1 Tax=Nocardia sp. NPDC005978 TaxID=3156725 RepID=UPI0033ADDABF
MIVSTSGEGSAMSAIQMPAPDGPVSAVFETPSGDGPWPGVVVLHDIAGLSGDIRRKTRLLADNGYLAVAPDLFSRGKARCVPSVFRDMLSSKDGRATRDIQAARALLTADERCTGKVAIVGFCLGGAFALLLAPQGFDVAAPFYPSGRGNYEEVLRGACPIVASYGANDPANRGRGDKLERVLTEYGIDHDVKTYAGVGHSFANDLPAQGLLRVAGLGYDEAATSDAWARIFAFFDTHLSPGFQPGGPNV